MRRSGTWWRTATRWTAPACPTCGPARRRPRTSSTEANWGQAPDGGWPATSTSDVASIDATCFRLAELAVPADDWLLATARQRLAVTQRSDGGWPSDDGPTFDVHTTLTAIRACR